MAKIKDLKMTREQRIALMSRIREEAKQLQNKAIEAVKATYIPSERYLKLVKTSNTYYKAAKQLQTVRNEIEENYPQFHPTAGNDLLDKIQKLEQKEQLEAAKIDFNFNNLESDLIHQEIEGTSIEELIAKSLTKYRIK